jgi:hypothetical protein
VRIQVSKVEVHNPRLRSKLQRALLKSRIDYIYKDYNLVVYYHVVDTDMKYTIHKEGTTGGCKSRTEQSKSQTEEFKMRSERLKRQLRCRLHNMMYLRLKEESLSLLHIERSVHLLGRNVAGFGASECTEGRKMAESIEQKERVVHIGLKNPEPIDDARVNIMNLEHGAILNQKEAALGRLMGFYPTKGT